MCDKIVKNTIVSSFFTGPRDYDFFFALTTSAHAKDILVVLSSLKLIVRVSIESKSSLRLSSDALSGIEIDWQA